MLYGSVHELSCVHDLVFRATHLTISVTSYSIRCIQIDRKRVRFSTMNSIFHQTHTHTLIHKCWFIFLCFGLNTFVFNGVVVPWPVSFSSLSLHIHDNLEQCVNGISACDYIIIHQSTRCAQFSHTHKLTAAATTTETMPINGPRHLSRMKICWRT